MRRVLAIVVCAGLMLGAFALSRATASPGLVIRTIPLRGGIGSIAFDERTRRLFVANAPNGIQVVDTRTGRLLRPIVLAGTQPGTLGMDAQTQRLFVLNVNLVDALSILDARSGTILKHLDPGSNGAPLIGSETLAVDARYGRGWVIIQGDASGTKLRLFDTRRGSLLPQASLAPPRQALTFEVSLSY